MKAYTDLEQSKKLAEILSIKSSDHHYVRTVTDFRGNPVDGEWSHPKYGNPNSRYANYIVQNFETYKTIPCWSLSALIELIPDECRMENTPLDQDGEFTYSFVADYYNIRTYEEGNPIDASYDTLFDTKFQTHKFDAMVYGLKEDLLLVTPLIEDRDEQEFANEEVADGVDIFDFKPYLFPMSSMTDEQQINLTKFVANCIHGENILYDWLNKNHFDYRGLIEKGLAIDATELNIY